MFCREKRIVKRTRPDGSVDYVGQTKKLLGGWQDGYGPRTGGFFSTYSQALEWYNERGINSCKDEVLVSDNGRGFEYVQDTSYRSNPQHNGSNYLNITEEMIEKYREL